MFASKHWNPVRIIQRFGRIDRIGSQNSVIQLVNYWPDMTLDEYINLKGRVESRMKATNLASTGDDNVLAPEERDLEYRKTQLKKLQEEVVDLEEMDTSVNIMDLGLNEFRLDLLEYMRTNHDVEHTPFGLHAVVSSTKDAPRGVIYVLKNRTASVNIDHKNQLHPFYMVYIEELNLDTVWENIVSTIGSVQVQEGLTLEQSILEVERKEAILKKIESLERKFKKENQAHRKYELHKQIQKLKTEI